MGTFTAERKDHMMIKSAGSRTKGHAELKSCSNFLIG